MSYSKNKMEFKKLLELKNMNRYFVTSTSAMILIAQACTGVPSSDTTKVEVRRSTDHNELRENRITLENRRKALMRLAEIQDDQGLLEIIELIKSPRVFDRESAAMALRYYALNPKGIEALNKLSLDAESVVRKAVIRSLMAVKDKTKFEPLAKNILSKAPNSPERVEALTLLFASTQNFSTKAQIEKELLENFKSNDLARTMSAGQALIRCCKESKAFHEQLKAHVKEAKTPQIFEFSFRILALKGDSFLENEIPKSLKSSDPNIRRTGITALFKMCSEDRWSSLKTLAQKEDHPMVLNEILRNAKQFGGMESAQVIDSLRGKSVIGKSLALPPAEEMSQWRNRNDRDPCTQKAMAKNQAQGLQRQGPPQRPGQEGRPVPHVRGTQVPPSGPQRPDAPQSPMRQRPAPHQQ